MAKAADERLQEDDADWVPVLTIRMVGPLPEAHQDLTDSLITRLLQDNGIPVRHSRPTLLPPRPYAGYGYGPQPLQWKTAYLVPKAQAKAARAILAEMDRSAAKEEDFALLTADADEDSIRKVPGERQLHRGASRWRRFNRRPRLYLALALIIGLSALVHRLMAPYYSGQRIKHGTVSRGVR